MQACANKFAQPASRFELDRALCLCAECHLVHAPSQETGYWLRSRRCTGPSELASVYVSFLHAVVTPFTYADVSYTMHAEVAAVTLCSLTFCAASLWAVLAPMSIAKPSDMQAVHVCMELCGFSVFAGPIQLLIARRA